MDWNTIKTWLVNRWAEPESRLAVAGAIGTLVALWKGAITGDTAEPVLLAEVVAFVAPGTMGQQFLAAITQAAQAPAVKKALLPFALVVGLGGLLSACATPPPISSNPIQDIPAIGNQVVPGLTGNLTTQFQNAEYNLTTAQTDGILSASDAAPGCVHSANVLLGIDPGGTPAQSFTPRVAGLIDAGSVGYILLQQALALKAQGITISPQCEQLIGHIVLQATGAGLNGGASILSGGLLSNVLPLAGSHRPARAVRHHP